MIYIYTLVQTRTILGTKKYMAPEMDNYHINNKFDLWSLGVILYELYTNKYIFYSENENETKNKKKNGIIIKETDNEMINKLIRNLIQVDIDKRIGWEEYFNDEFFKIKEEKKKNKKAESELNGNLLVK